MSDDKGLTPRQQYEQKQKEEAKIIDQQANQETMTEVSSDNYRFDPDYNHFADFLGVETGDRGNYDLASKIDLIYQWGERQGRSQDRVDVSLAIKNLKDYLGLNVTGKTLVNKLYQWVRLDQDRRRAEKEMKLIET